MHHIIFRFTATRFHYLHQFLIILILSIFSTSEVWAQTTMPNTFSLSPLVLFQQADIIVKSIITILIVVSFVTWFIWVLKILEIKKQKKLILNSIRAIENNTSLSEKIHIPDEASRVIYEIALHEYQLTMNKKVIHDSTIKERVETLIERVTTNEKHRLSYGTAYLATTGSVAPFIGLLGTVWGIMHSFVAIAQSNITSLSVVAPGIAEALFATALGLFTAIPAVILYNHLVRLITQYSLLIEDIAALVMVQLSHDLDKLQEYERNFQQLGA